MIYIFKMKYMTCDSVILWLCVYSTTYIITSSLHALLVQVSMYVHEIAKLCPAPSSHHSHNTSNNTHSSLSSSLSLSASVSIPRADVTVGETRGVRGSGKGSRANSSDSGPGGIQTTNTANIASIEREIVACSREIMAMVLH